MNTISLETGPPIGAPLKSHYEALTADMLQMLWRRRLMLAAIAIGSLLLGLAVLVFMDRRYTSEAVFQLDFERAGAPKAGAAPLTAIMDPAALVEGEARIIRSRPMARRVVMRLGLDKDPAFVPRRPIISVVGKFNRPGSISSRVDRTATELMKHVTVSNDMRSYLITVSVIAYAPEKAAEIANAFVTEYLQSRMLQKLRKVESGAFSALSDLGKIYGDKHPAIIQAKGNLRAAREQVRRAQRSAAQRIGPANPLLSPLVGLAKPVLIPTGPSSVLILGLSVIGGLAAGIGLAVLLEKRDTGFRTEAEVRAYTGLRCLAMVPMVAISNSGERTAEHLEAMRSVCLAAGLGGKDASARVVMVTSSVPSEGKSTFVSSLARSLVDQGARVLILNATPRSCNSGSQSIEELLESRDALQTFLDERQGEPLSRLCRASGLIDGHGIFATRSFDRLRKEVLKSYDVVLIEAPPTIVLADTITLGRIADRSIHIARWNSTPRRTVAAAVQQLRDASIRIDGIVLTGVDLALHRTYRTGDQCHNFTKYEDFYKSKS